jgi:O-antigen biosynthesis protein
MIFYLIEQRCNWIIKRYFSLIKHLRPDMKPKEEKKSQQSGTGADESALEEKLIQARNEIQILNDQLETAFKSIDKLVRQMVEMDSHRLNKFRKYYNHYLKRLKSNLGKSDHKNFFSVMVFYVFGRGGKILRMLISKVLKALYLRFETKNVVIIELNEEYLATTNEYSQYLYKRKLTKGRLAYIRRQIEKFKTHPSFSVIIPLYNPQTEFLQHTLESVINQIYQGWEICVADDRSDDPEVKEMLETYSQKNPKIKVVYRSEKGDISNATNSALELAKGDYVIFMDQEDLIREDALFLMASLINRNQDADLIYSDEDKIDELNIHSEPHFKPDWSPDSLLSRNYMGHLCTYKLENVMKLNGLRVGFEGSQDYDLALRYTECFTKIHHIAEVLYHGRITSESTVDSKYVKPYAYRSAQNSLIEAFARRGWTASIDFLEGFRGYSVRLKLEDDTRLVSIIIPSKNQASFLDRCLSSIDQKSTYRNFEIILIDNNSDEKEFFRIVNKWQEKKSVKIRYIKDDAEFNFSRLINTGRKNAGGDYLLFLNNDTEVISPDWIEGFLEHAQRPEIGVVGCKLLYPDNTIQHAGMVVGQGGGAGHVLVGEDRYGPGYFNYVNLLNNYSALTAACFLVRTKVFDEVGGFDEYFSTEYNDVDFCLKVKEAGYNNIYVPNIELYHYESITRGHPHRTQESYRLHVKEFSRFSKKWKKYIEHDPCYNSNLSLENHFFGLKI